MQSSYLTIVITMLVQFLYKKIILTLNIQLYKKLLSIPITITSSECRKISFLYTLAAKNII